MYAIARACRNRWAFPAAFAVTLSLLGAVAAASGPAHGAEVLAAAEVQQVLAPEGGYGVLGLLFIAAALAMLTFGWRTPGASRRRD